MAIAEDASSPTPTRLTRVTTAALASGSFTPPAASMEVVLYGLEFGTAPAAITTPTVSSTAGGAWTTGPLIKASNVSGCLICFWRYNATAPGAHTVTVTRTEVGSADAMLAVRVLTGTDTSLSGSAAQNINTSAAAGVQQTVTPVRANSYIAIAAAINSSGTLTANGNTTQFDLFNDTSNGSNIGTGRGTSVAGAAGVGQSLGWTGITTNNQLWIALEVFAAVAAVTAQKVVPRNRARFRAATW